MILEPEPRVPTESRAYITANHGRDLVQMVNAADYDEAMRQRDEAVRLLRWVMDPEQSDACENMSRAAFDAIKAFLAKA